MITIHIETENKAFEFSEDIEINNILSNISPVVTKVVYCGNVAQKYPVYDSNSEKCGFIATGPVSLYSTEDIKSGLDAEANAFCQKYIEMFPKINWRLGNDGNIYVYMREGQSEENKPFWQINSWGVHKINRFPDRITMDMSQQENLSALKAMDFSELGKHFNRDMHTLPEATGRILCHIEFERSCISDQFIDWLKVNEYLYINSMGKAWFTIDGEIWHTFESEYDKETNFITFFEKI